MKKSPIQELIYEMRKSPLMYAAALILIENGEYIQKELEYYQELLKNEKQIK